MTTSRYWTSPDGRRTIDLDAVSEHWIYPDGDVGIGIQVGCGMSELQTQDAIDSFLAALKAWRDGVDERRSWKIESERRHRERMLRYYAEEIGP